MIKLLYHWLAKKWLHFHGVRFYEGKYVPKSAKTISTTFMGTRIDDNDTEVSFEFYREIFKDNIYRPSKFEVDTYHVFIVKAKFRGIEDERFAYFNDTNLLCKSIWIYKLPDEVVVDVLQGLYIAFIKEHLLKT